MKMLIDIGRVSRLCVDKVNSHMESQEPVNRLAYQQAAVWP